MNLIPLAILILSATGEARRELQVEQEPIGIVARVAWGAVSDVIGSERTGRIDLGGLVRQEVLRTAVLTIDNQPRTGWRSWTEAAWRVAGYAIDRRNTGSVWYAYSVRVRGYDVRRETRIEDGRVLLTTTADWTETVPVIGRITREVPIHVQIVVSAIENERGTVLSGVATGTADTSDFRCRRIRNNRAEPGAADTLREELGRALDAVRRRGTNWYHGADEISGILDQIGAGMRTVGPMIGRRR